MKPLGELDAPVPMLDNNAPIDRVKLRDAVEAGLLDAEAPPGCVWRCTECAGEALSLATLSVSGGCADRCIPHAVLVERRPRDASPVEQAALSMVTALDPDPVRRLAARLPQSLVSVKARKRKGRGPERLAAAVAKRERKALRRLGWRRDALHGLWRRRDGAVVAERDLAAREPSEGLVEALQRLAG